MARPFAFCLCAALLLPGAGTAQTLHLQRLDVGATAGPWQAVGRLDLGARGFCTATLVARDLVVTAAHCLYDRVTGARLDQRRRAVSRLTARADLLTGVAARPISLSLRCRHAGRA